MMSMRMKKVTETMKQEIGRILAYDMNDPRIGFVTVTRVEVAADIRSARVYISVLGDEKSRKGTLAGVKHAKGYIQRETASRLRTKYTPTLSFFIDDGVTEGVRISNIIDKVIAESRRDGDEDAAD